MTHPIFALFVYGTLQCGECRARFWPHPPLIIESATTRGGLYDLGPYPALVPGSDVIGGELWRLRQEHMPHTLAVLDEVEDAVVGEEGLYARRIVACGVAHRDALPSAASRSSAPCGETVWAFAYFHTRPGEIAHYPRIGPDDDGVCRWRAKAESS